MAGRFQRAEQQQGEIGSHCLVEGDAEALARRPACSPADSPPLVVQGTLRALWTAFDTSRSQAIDLANLFTRIGSDAAAFKAGQERFASGERPNWIVR